MALMAPGLANGEEVSAAGSLGVGMFGQAPSTTFDVGIDLSGEHYAVGVGARLRLLAGEGLRDEDWDEKSELARIIRYAVYRLEPEDDDDATRLSVATGELGGATLGEGILIDGYATGVDADHGRLGAQLRFERQGHGVEGLVDDVIAPRIAGARTYVDLAGRYRVGASLVADFSAPRMGDDVWLSLASADASVFGHRGKHASGRFYAAIAGAFGLAVGGHLGADGELGNEDVRAGARLEVRAGSDNYLPDWVGPLYERDRRQVRDARGNMVGSQLDLAEAGGLAGFGIEGQLRLSLREVGELSGTYSIRKGAADLMVGRLLVPFFVDFQAGAWAAAELTDRGLDAFALAAEVRAKLPHGLFVTLEASRLYRDDEGAYVPLWVASAAVGGVIGE
jgi:hypothetical protein